MSKLYTLEVIIAILAIIGVFGYVYNSANRPLIVDVTGDVPQTSTKPTSTSTAQRASNTTSATNTATTTGIWNFNQVGTIINNNPAQGNSDLSFAYDRPNAPSLLVKLALTNKSICRFDLEAVPCIELRWTLETGSRLSISGLLNGDTVTVHKITYPSVIQIIP